VSLFTDQIGAWFTCTNKGDSDIKLDNRTEGGRAMGKSSGKREDRKEVLKRRVPNPEVEGTVPFETGTLPKDGIEAILNTLPVDITFVDHEDTVRYFSQSKDRIFARAKAIIGRKVQQCHPQKSVHVVEKILKAFKSGRKDVAEFWLNLKDRLIHIRYFAVRDEKGEYLGCLEVTQDITDIKKIEGERRLLDWED